MAIKTKNINETTEKIDKTEKIMNGVNIWCSFYRANPQRFVRDYLGIKLRLFQQILIVMMNINTSFCLCAARGIGKSFMLAIFCCVRCILYPNTQIIITSGTKGQALEIIEKIVNILMPESANLRLEIKDYSTNPTAGFVQFHNGSMVRIAASNQNSRHFRANIVINFYCLFI